MTDLDIARECKARGLNARLVGTGLYVTAGGRVGPYVLHVSRLSHERLLAIIAAIEASGLVVEPAPDSR